MYNACVRSPMMSDSKSSILSKAYMRHQESANEESIETTNPPYSSCHVE